MNAFLATVFSAFLLLPAVAAASSLSYQNAQGSLCHQWDRTGQCIDWSVYGQGGSYSTTTPPPAFGGSTLLYRPNFPVYTCQNPTVDCTGSVTIRATGSPNPAQRGGVLTYRIYVRNDDSQNRTVNVKAYIDPNAVTFQDATFAGYSDKTTIRWNSQSIPARSSRTLVLRVRVRNDATLTKPVLLRIQTDRSSDVVSVNVDDSDRFYDNAIQYNTRGYIAPSGRPPRIRRASHNTSYYYDENGVLHYRSQGEGYYCDPRQYVCQQ